MTLIRPYGGQEARVVSDLSRFEYENRDPRRRSRNTTPTSIKSGIQTSEYPTETFYEHYADSSVADEPIRPFAPYPADIVEQMPYNSPHKLHNPRPPSPEKPLLHNLQEFRMPPPPPPKDPGLYPYQGRDALPPMEDSRDYQRQRDSQATMVPGAPQGQYPQQGNVKGQAPQDYLLERVMNRPLVTIGPKDIDPFDPNDRRSNFHVTASNIIDVFQIMFGIIIIALASILGSQDQRVSLGIYRYFIAVGVITLVVSLLFLTKAINFERRNGIFYCLLACVLTGVSLVLSIVSVATNNNCKTTSICSMRKALSTFAILSFFLWLCMLVMFLTVLYISRLNLLEEVNFDYSRQGLKNNVPSRVVSQQDQLPPQPQPELEAPKYYLTESGDMYPLENQDIRGKKKIVVYA